jgi:hypothetical protein
VSTEEVVAPLDAYTTAKPDEPTFTLQGGDPLAAPLVRAWAFLARRRAGVVRFEQGSFAELIEAPIGNSVADDEREKDNLLVRATAAEQVSWTMDAYRKGDHATDRPTEAADTHLTELQRIDLHDLRVRVAQKLSNFRCEIEEMHEALTKAGYVDVDDGVGNMIAMSDLKTAAYNLKLLNEMIEPRRMMKDR